MVEVLEPLPGETPMLYECGFAVVGTGDTWHMPTHQELVGQCPYVRCHYVRRTKIFYKSQLRDPGQGLHAGRVDANDGRLRCAEY